MITIIWIEQFVHHSLQLNWSSQRMNRVQENWNWKKAWTNIVRTKIHNFFPWHSSHLKSRPPGRGKEQWTREQKEVSVNNRKFATKYRNEKSAQSGQVMKNDSCRTRHLRNTAKIRDSLTKRHWNLSSCFNFP